MRKMLIIEIIIGCILAVVLFGWLFAVLAQPPAFDTRVFLEMAAKYDALIIFNSGGWGNTPLYKATDFASILNGIQGTLADLGYSSTVIEFVRTPGGLSSRLFDIKELINDFDYSSQVEAEQVRLILKNRPEKKVIVTGLSNGGATAERTMERLENSNNVFAVVAGAPGWYRRVNSDNLIALDNNKKDALAAGSFGKVVLALVRSPFVWLYHQLIRQPISLAIAIQIEGHEYAWSSPAVGSPIQEFLKSKLGKKAS